MGRTAAVIMTAGLAEAALGKPARSPRTQRPTRTMRRDARRITSSPLACMHWSSQIPPSRVAASHARAGDIEFFEPATLT